MNFHSFWDAGAFSFAPNNSFLARPLTSSDLEYVDKWANDLMKKYPISKYGNYDMTYLTYYKIVILLYGLILVLDKDNNLYIQ